MKYRSLLSIIVAVVLACSATACNPGTPVSPKVERKAMTEVPLTQTWNKLMTMSESVTGIKEFVVTDIPDPRPASDPNLYWVAITLDDQGVLTIAIDPFPVSP